MEQIPKKIQETILLNINHISYLKNLPNKSSNILLLGEGNFSFSLSLARVISEQVQHKKLQNIINLYSTSFDSRNDLLEKYPEFEVIEKKLQNISKKKNDIFNIQLLHSVDATNIKNSLNKQLDIHNIKNRDLLFDKIIFNHPHTGQDDLRKNSSLVAHYFYSALENLRSENSEIQYSLLAGQNERWKLPEISSNYGLKLLHEEPLQNFIYENGFEARRNLVGTNFQNSNIAKTFDKFNLDSRHYVLCTSQEFEPIYQELRQIQEKELIQQQQQQQQQKQQQEPKKNKKLQEEQQQFEFFCKYCNKGFRKEQGKRTHEREEHEKKQNKKQQKFKCTQCEKEFKSDAGLQDHIQQKHQEDTLVKKPDFAGVKLEIVNTKESENIQENQQICEICFQQYETKEELINHYKWLTPDLKPEQIIKCEYCKRIFKEQRALQQHLFTCKFNTNNKNIQQQQEEEISNKKLQE